MRFKIVHEIRGRMRIHMACKRMSFKEADILQYYLSNQPFITAAKVYERNQDAAVCYTGDREAVLRLLKRFSFENVSVPDYVWQNSGREMSREYGDRIVERVIRRAASRLFLPMPVRTAVIGCRSARYIWRGLRCLGRGRIEVPVLDGTAIAVSLLRRDPATAIAAKVGVDEYYPEVLPEDKAEFIKKEKATGRKVIMAGDGINDSPALSAADVGIAISDGAEIAREIADITIGADHLSGLVTLRAISGGLIRRIRKNYLRIVGINSGLILLGIAGRIQPASSAMIHNVSMLVIGVNSMKNLLSHEK